MTTDELLEQAQTLMDKPTMDEEYLNIDWESRLITVPSSLTNIGVYNDKDTNRLYFRCPIEYGEFKIADFGIHVNYQNTGVSRTTYDGDVYFCDDVESDGDYLTFSWLVGRHAYLEEGTTAFIVCCKVVDSDDNVVNELNTTVATLSVLEGLEVDVLPPEDYPDYLEELLRRVETAEETADSALTTAQEVKDSALTGVTVNGDPAPVTNHVAEIEVDAGVAYSFCDTAARVQAKEIETTLVLEDGAVLAVNFLEGNTNESIRLVGGRTAADTLGDARCSANSFVFFVYSEADNAFVVDAGLTRANEANDAIPTKVSELDNDSGYITDSALEDCATKEAVETAQSTADSALEKAEAIEGEIPTKVSELDNDAGYVDSDALDEVKKTAITGITVNGTEQPVNDNIAELTIGESAIEHIQVNGTEQPIEDKTVNLAIDRASVDGETLIVGDTTGGGQDQRIVTGTLDESGEVTIEGEMVVFFSGDDSWDAFSAYIVGGSTKDNIMNDNIRYTVTHNGNKHTFSAWEGCRYIAIIME